MTILAPWLSALRSPRSILISSSPRLLAEIQSRQATRTYEFAQKGKVLPNAKAAVTSVSAFQPDITIPVIPFELLHSIGRITTPPIPNLVDISSTWACIRYLWAFSDSGRSFSPLLRLSKTARDLDFHQKALLSDEMGMGFAHYIMAKFLNAVNPVDISYAIAHPSYGISHAGGPSPDYLFFDETSGAKYVVECKGTQTSHAASIAQLQRGTEQVWTINPTDGSSLVKLVIATCLLSKRTEVYVVDPESDQPEADDSPMDDGSRERRTLDTNGPFFRRNVRLIGRAKTLAFTGLNEEAYSLLPEYMQEWARGVPPSQSPVETLTTSLGVFDGTKVYLTLTDGTRIEIFRGILSETRMAFGTVSQEQEIENETAPTMVPKFYTDGFEGKSYITLEADTVATFAVQTFCIDGTILQVTIQVL